MRRQRSPLLRAVLLVALWTAAAAAQADTSTDAARAQFAVSLTGSGRQVTQHSLMIRGQRIDYDATLGGIELRDSSSRPIAVFVYTAYTRRGAGDVTRRPITFAWNGGPSVASTGLHFSVLGPRRRAVDDSGRVTTPIAFADNAQSILDRTDLVMVDPVGTGFSVPVGATTLKEFYSLKKDAASVAQFITRYLEENGRLQSPAYLIGQSYGTVRNPLVANYLQGSGVPLAGIVFVSSALDGNTIWEASGHLEPYYFYLPTYAAIAWHHRRLPWRPKDLPTLVAEVQRFAITEFLTALVAWPEVTREVRSNVLAKLQRYTGLSSDYWEKAGLRVGTVDFARELLRDQNRVLVINDGRQSSPIRPGGAAGGANPGGAPAGASGDPVMMQYLRDELRVTGAPAYRTAAPGANDWHWFDHGLRSRAPVIPSYQNFLDDLATAMKSNPRLRVQQHSGLFDLQCAAFPANWAMARMSIPDSLRRNVAMFDYASGHAVYSNAPAEFLKFTANLAAFYDASSADGAAKASARTR